MTCTNEGPLQCGCNDGVVYWNSCTRQQNLVSAGQDCTPETAFLKCGDGTRCSIGSCNEITGMCNANAPVISLGCYVLPQTCTTDSTEKHYMSCGSTECLDLCTAIRHEQPFVYAGPPFGFSCP